MPRGRSKRAKWRFAVSISMNTQELAELDKQADIADMDRSEYVRKLIRDDAEIEVIQKPIEPEAVPKGT